MVNTVIEESSKEEIIVRCGDAVLHNGDLYFAMPTEMGKKIVFFTFYKSGQTNIWASCGIDASGSRLHFDKVIEHFGNENLKLIPREEIEMTIKVNI